MAGIEELYELCGFGWRLPIVVKWTLGQAEVSLAQIPLLKAQVAAAMGLLDRHAHHRAGAFWYRSRKTLSACAIPSQFDDPEAVVVWNSTVTTQVAVPIDFTHAYCKSRDSVVRDPATFKIIWSSICKFLLDWLVLQEKEVDLGFAKLNALPMRRDWKSRTIGILLSKMRKCGNVLRPSQEVVLKYLLSILRNESLTAFDEKSNTIRWSLNIEPLRPFHDTARRAEARRKMEAPEGDYALAISGMLKSIALGRRAYNCIESTMHEMEFPALRLPQDDSPDERIAPVARSGRAVDRDTSKFISEIVVESRTGFVSPAPASLSPNSTDFNAMTSRICVRPDSASAECDAQR